MKQHTIRRKTLAVIAAAAMMLANFALNGSALADTGRANPQSDVTVIALRADQPADGIRAGHAMVDRLPAD